jgi:NADP-dependent aldehyde dehydrogenase
MGSHNPAWVLPGALAARGEAIATALAASATLGTGQFCTKPGVVFVPTGDDGDRFVATLAAAIDATTVGPMLDARIAATYTARARTLTDLEGVRTVTARTSDADAAGWRATPTVLEVTDATWLAHAALREECFGPLVVAVRVAAERLVTMVASLPGGLAASIHSDADDRDLARALVAAVADRVGRIVHDGFPTGVAVTWAQQHGGPYPATTSPSTTSPVTTSTRYAGAALGAVNCAESLRPIVTSGTARSSAKPIARQ